jgi:ABC-type multidrug transport system fused ATPase/permease subunit
MVVLLYAPAASVDSTLLIVTYVLCAVSPACNIIRTLFVALNVFSLDCTESGVLRKDMASISLYGGPLLFLSLQIVVFTALLIWNELGSSWLLPRRKGDKANTIEARAVGFADENCPPGLGSGQEGLRVVHVTKSFGSFTALDDVSLDIGKGEVLALLGPNGAGKSTLISLIRGDVQPTGPHGDIFVQDISVLKDRSSARANMGVCPQIDGSFSSFQHFHATSETRTNL